MARFRDKRTGDIIEVTNRARIINRRQRRDRFEEITGDDRTVSNAAESTLPDAGSPDVPEGTVPELLEWAGDDPVRRGALLAAEMNGKQRKTLLEELS